MPGFDFGPVPPPPPRASHPAQEGSRLTQSHVPKQSDVRGFHTNGQRGRGGLSYNGRRGGANQRARGGHNAGQNIFTRPLRRGHGALYDAQQPLNSSNSLVSQPLLRPSRTENVAPPVVPSFGFSLPSAAVTPLAHHPEHGRPSKKKRRVENTLGITPKTDVTFDSDEDVDEEALFLDKNGADVSGAPGIFFKTAAEKQAWLAERKRRYPTAARREEAKRVKDEAERSQKEAELARLRNRVVTSRKVSAPREQDRAPISSKKGAREHPQAHKKCSDGTTQKMSKTKISLLSSAYDSDTESVEDEKLKEQQGSSSSSDTSSTSDYESSSDSDSPEVEVSSQTIEHEERPEQPPSSSRSIARTKLPPPVELLPYIKKGFCRYFLEKGWCRNQTNGSCRFTHKRPFGLRDQPKAPRSSLYEKLVKQELRTERLSAVRAIKILGASGFFDD